MNNLMFQTSGPNTSEVPADVIFGFITIALDNDDTVGVTSTPEYTVFERMSDGEELKLAPNEVIASALAFSFIAERSPRFIGAATLFGAAASLYCPFD